MGNRPSNDLPPINSADIMGRWFQISRNKNPFQDPNSKNAFSDFSVNPDGSIKTYHSETLPSGKINSMDGIGYVDQTGRNYVSSSGELMTIYEFLPEVGFSIFGDPKRGYIWIMSKNRYPEAYDYHRVLNLAKTHGISFDELIPTYQDDS